MKKARVMLYVENVQATADFWEKYLSFETEETIELGTSQSIVLHLDDHFRVQLFEQAFIKEVSPEVSFETPSIAIFVDNLEDYHQQVANGQTFVSPIGDHGGQLSFNFQDNEGRYFAAIQM